MAASILLLLCAFAITLQAHDVSSWSFSAVTKPLVPKKNPVTNQTTISVTCYADVPLVTCQFNVCETGFRYSPIDLSKGHNSGVVMARFLSIPMFHATYNGTGLGEGQCGAVLTVDSLMFRHVGCRGANAAGEWHYMDFSVVLGETLDVPARIFPTEVIAKPGTDVTVLLQTDPGLEFDCICALMLHSATPHLHVYSQGFPHSDNNSLSSTELPTVCELTLRNITDEDNGPMLLIAISDKIIQRSSTIIVSAPPAEVSFKVDKISYSVGDTLNATCSSLLSRPVANLTWTLDDKIIRQDVNLDVGGDVWSWSWEKQNITQILSLKLKEEDFGKKLECRVQHLDIVNSNSSCVITQLV